MPKIVKKENLHVVVDDIPYDIEVQKSRNLGTYLRVRDAKLILRLSKHDDVGDVIKFVKKQIPIILKKQLSQKLHMTRIDFDRHLIYSFGFLRRFEVVDHNLIIHALLENYTYPLEDDSNPTVALKIEQFWKEQLIRTVYQINKNYLDKINVLDYYRGFEIVKVSSYWGQNNAKNGIIRYNLHLACYPYEAIESIVVHELCHYKIRKHNQEFYDLVYRYFPDYRKYHKLLK